MAFFVRRMVSQNKKRYQANGFDLDLAYITPRIVAMGFPAAGPEGLFRNPLAETVRFLTTYHKDHFKVYNLCNERSYDVSKMRGPVCTYACEDHQAPALCMVQDFCEDACAWLQDNAEHVVVVHCKAGKGRTGTMICSLLLYMSVHAPQACPQFSTQSCPVESVLDFYARARTNDLRGVTIASQRRYVRYFWECITRRVTLEERSLCLRELHISLLSSTLSLWGYKVRVSTRSSVTGAPGHVLEFNIPTAHSSWWQSVPCLTTPANCVSDGSGFLASCSCKHGNITILFPKNSEDIDGYCVRGDVKIEVFKLTKSSHALFYTWFNTEFLKNCSSYVLCKDQLDKVHKGLSDDVKLELKYEFVGAPPPAIDEAGLPMVSPNDSIGIELSRVNHKFSLTPAFSADGFDSVHSSPNRASFTAKFYRTRSMDQYQRHEKISLCNHLSDDSCADRERVDSVLSANWHGADDMKGRQYAMWRDLSSAWQRKWWSASEDQLKLLN